jgi:selenocysteine-specific translation elongation factor
MVFNFNFSASLIRTVIGGAQIIDLMFLVIDAGKGMQTQTAECLILGEITWCQHYQALCLNHY